MKTRTPVFLNLLSITTAMITLAAVWVVLFLTPIEAVMGNVQKVFYFHVSCGWVGMLSFLCAAVSGGVYLANRKTLWDKISLSSVEIGLVFTLACILSGSIWAKPVWNTWWTWDPRLTTITIMALIYVAYLLLRRGLDDSEKSARFAAVYAVLGFISVPLTFVSIRLLRAIHPVVIGSGSEAASSTFNLAPEMVTALLISLTAFTLIFVTFLWHRTRLGLLEQEKDIT